MDDERHVFVASRFTAGNLIFPVRIEITPEHVCRIKPRLIGSTEESIAIHKVASVTIATGLIWSDIRIDSTGGSNPIASHGHTRGDARRIRELIESYQRQPEL
ncbi:MAG TPA: hypothetical protein VJS92_03795 [Candidatus Polarisedimenticolaceae bacterium]|nr:hypothetical protein [Candidatus Polarisedimenticolaceae bacterium]